MISVLYFWGIIMGMLVKRVNNLCNKLEKKICIPLLAKSRRKRLKYDDFTIISNNCWGGCCYEFFGMPKLSPTVGAYFFAEDYVKLCANLRKYLSLDLKFIPPESSRHVESIKKQNNSNAIIGKLDDVEIVFLHYPNADVILEKWNRRVKRINWDRVILKFSYQNECSDALVEEFLRIPDYPKFVLVGEPITQDRDEIVFQRSNGKETVDETVNFNRFINPINIINDRI